MAIIFGDRNNNTIAAAAAGTTIFGMSGADTLSSAFETADLRGGWGADVLTVGYSYAGTVETTPVHARWAASADQGNDNINIAYNLQYYSAPTIIFASAIVEVIVDGGQGDDTILISGSSGGARAIEAEFSIVDLEGSNFITLDNTCFVGDIGFVPISNINIILGDGADKISIDQILYNPSNASFSQTNIDMGNGDNILNWREASGRVTGKIISGDGEDNINLSMISIYNEEGQRVNLDVESGGGNDTVKVYADSTDYEFENFKIVTDLGQGDNTFEFSRVGWGSWFDLDVKASFGDDVIVMDFGEVNDELAFEGNIDAGDGNNSISLTFGDVYAWRWLSLIFTGSGRDTITLNGTFGTTISSGAGSDIVVSGSGADTISSGIGGDTITVAKSIFDTSAAPQQTLTLTDFSLSDLDKLTLTGFTLAGSLADGTFDTAADFVALKTPGGDVLSFVQAGADALLTLNLGGGETGQILFQNFTIPTLDAPRSFTGTSANNTFVGGNNSDQFFLKLGQDRATGNAGADLFRVNAVTSHNNNGDRHTITDLSFAEGDVLRFDNFGPGWANNAVNPANDLQYVAGSFNNWIVNSLADLRELRDSGAVTVSAITGGSRILFEDQAGDDIRIDLLGVFI